MKNNPFEKPQTVDSFSNLSESNYIGDPSRLESLKFIMSKIPEHGVGLDIGCGAGRISLLLKDRYSFVGIDNSQAMIDKAKILCPESEFWCKDVVSQFDYLNREFDFAIAFGLSMYLRFEEFNRVVNNSLNSLKLKGWLVFNVLHPLLFDPSFPTNYFNNSPINLRRDSSDSYKLNYFAKDGSFFEAKVYDNYKLTLELLNSLKKQGLIDFETKAFFVDRDKLDKTGGRFKESKFIGYPFQSTFRIKKLIL